MGIESVDDRKAYVDIFGESATIGGVTVNAIYDDPHFEALEMSTSTPMLTVVTEDLPAVEFGSTVSVPTISYNGTVKDIQDDGTGITVLMLKDA